MKYWLHLTIAAGLTLATSFFILKEKIAFDATTIAVIGFGALLPDADERKTKAFKLLLLLSFVVSAFISFKIIQNTAIAIIVGAIASLTLFLLKPRHRGITHSLPAALAYAAIILFSTKSTGLALLALASYSSHLIADGMIN